jgi:hypothetical protein
LPHPNPFRNAGENVTLRREGVKSIQSLFILQYRRSSLDSPGSFVLFHYIPSTLEQPKKKEKEIIMRKAHF